MATENTENTDVNYDSFLSRETINAVPQEIVEMFENLTLVVLEDLQIGLPFVGLKYFKNKILPQRIAFRASYVMAQIVVQRMIAEGKLKIEQIEDKKYTEFPISVVTKG